MALMSKWLSPSLKTDNSATELNVMASHAFDLAYLSDKDILTTDKIYQGYIFVRTTEKSIIQCRPIEPTSNIAAAHQREQKRRTWQRATPCGSAVLTE